MNGRSNSLQWSCRQIVDGSKLTQDCLPVFILCKNCGRVHKHLIKVLLQCLTHIAWMLINKYLCIHKTTWQDHQREDKGVPRKSQVNTITLGRKHTAKKEYISWHIELKGHKVKDTDLFIHIFHSPPVLACSGEGKVLRAIGFAFFFPTLPQPLHWKDYWKLILIWNGHKVNWTTTAQAQSEIMHRQA